MMAGGAPRTVCFPPEEMIALGKEMVAWVEEKKPLHLSEWYTIEKMFTYNEWKTFIVKKEFFPYYEKALKIVAKRYLDGTINPSIAHRFINVYFKDVKEEEKEGVTFKAQIDFDFRKKLLELELKLKAHGDNPISDEIKAQYSALMAQFTSLQTNK